MATQRVGKGSSEEKKNGSVKENVSSGESSIKKERQSKKAKILKEQQSSKFRWVLVAVLLVIAAIGLCYYLWYYQVDVPQQRTKPSKAQREKSKTGKPSSDKQKPSKQKQKKANKAKSQEKPKSRQTAEAEKGEEEFQRLEKVKNRVLRQPITGSDPDRPHLMDIITADNLLIAGNYQEALERFNAILSKFPQSPRAQFGKGLTLSQMAREKRSNKLMETAIDFFRMAGMDSILSNDDIKIASLVAMVDLAQKNGKIQLAVRGMETLAELRSDNVTYANELGNIYLDQGNMLKAKSQFKKCMENFEDNNFARAQLGFILYTEKRYEEALPLIMEGIRLDDNIRQNGFFYNYAGDSLYRLNRTEEAFALYGEAVALGLFPSEWQRSLLNEPDLRAQPWWSVEDTGYLTDITRMEKSMATITSEVMAILDAEKNVFTPTSRHKEAPHYILFSKGKKDLNNCVRVPKTCALLETFPEAAGCKRGTVKLSIMPPKTHIAPHVGGTNIKLQVLVALNLDTEGKMKIRMGQETKLMGHGQIAVIDESFEKEMWYVGEVPAVYLTVDVWHPDLSEQRKRQLTLRPQAYT